MLNHNKYYQPKWSVGILSFTINTYPCIKFMFQLHAAWLCIASIPILANKNSSKGRIITSAIANGYI